ncbi:NlpC/P60 family protein [Citricoccus sp. SGAir0253]|uniref:C40 family peptidase n=1 Tax=Citricoccus sp. SGAir0253 TaxID=2567881 RepID=UPI0010CD0AD1|nr:C40 family peptidase [Citricoccus sp. SGAir0253]QCU79176.1 NlpC/P60 family protein [Citricoccus sp. SGAir0253]
MNYPSRRARLEAEKLSARSRRRRSLTVSAAGLATLAGATLAGVAPASAHDGGVSTTDYSAQQDYSYSSASTSTSSSTASTSTASGGTYQLASYSTSSATGWQADVAQWAAAKAADPSVYYSWGGNGPTAYDCSGYTQQAFAQAGKSIPRTSSAQFYGGQQVSMSNLQVGDLVFWSNNGSGSGVYHVAIYIGDGKIAHARNPQMGVAVTDLDYSPWNMMSTAVRY